MGYKYETEETSFRNASKTSEVYKASEVRKVSKIFLHLAKVSFREFVLPLVKAKNGGQKLSNWSEKFLKGLVPEVGLEPT